MHKKLNHPMSENEFIVNFSSCFETVSQEKYCFATLKIIHLFLSSNDQDIVGLKLVRTNVGKTFGFATSTVLCFSL